MPFVPIDYPREVLELSSTGIKLAAHGKNADELESYWRGKNGSGNVYFTTTGTRHTSTEASPSGLQHATHPPLRDGL